ncbi:hypothetical protein LUQ84_000934 [Hamiltosporidium tvaerminnensis]|nr:hypothetical protein LUQ84_000934 [Hamiltosporidium tvaerminnensis]
MNTYELFRSRIYQVLDTKNIVYQKSDIDLEINDDDIYEFKRYLNIWNISYLKSKLFKKNKLIIYIFESMNILKYLKITNKDLSVFINTVFYYYGPNAYHNEDHIIDVFISSYYLLKKIDNINQKTALIILVSALLHDIGHLGLSTKYLSSQKYFTDKFDRSSLCERIHCFISNLILNTYECNILRNLKIEERNEINFYIQQLILSTDILEQEKYINMFICHHHDFFFSRLDKNCKKDNECLKTEIIISKNSKNLNCLNYSNQRIGIQAIDLYLKSNSKKRNLESEKLLAKTHTKRDGHYKKRRYYYKKICQVCKLKQKNFEIPIFTIYLNVIKEIKKYFKLQHEIRKTARKFVIEKLNAYICNKSKILKHFEIYNLFLKKNIKNFEKFSIFDMFMIIKIADISATMKDTGSCLYCLKMLLQELKHEAFLTNNLDKLSFKCSDEMFFFDNYVFPVCKMMGFYDEKFEFLYKNANKCYFYFKNNMLNHYFLN